MPTYENDTATDLILRGPNGAQAHFTANETKAVAFYSDSDGFTKTLDTPYLNRIAARETVTLSATASTVTVGLHVSELAIFQITGSVSVYLQNEANTPAELDAWTANDPVILIPAAGKFTQLQLTGTGTCVVVQYK